MESEIIVKFWVEGGGNLMSLTGSDNMTVDNCKRLTVVTCDSINVRCSDEGHRHVIAYTRDMTSSMEAAELTAISIAAHTDTHRT